MLALSIHRDFSIYKLSHPAYSLDLAPSNFHLFGHAKGQLAGGLFSLTEEFLAGIEQIPGKNPLEILTVVFYEWKTRLLRHVDTD
jgi:hypothetical protein